MLKSILKRFLKATAATVLASAASQSVPICTALITLIPQNLYLALGYVGLSPDVLCTGALTGAILAAEKWINWQPSNNGGVSHS